MSAEVLRRAAEDIRNEWADAELHIKPTAFYLAVADWLEKTAVAVEHGGSHALFAAEALTVARAYLGESA